MRIVTRPDFDGIVCAVLLSEAEPIDAPVLWVQPGEMQQGRVAISAGDIIANLPFDPRCALWFDHHFTNRVAHPFQGVFRIAPSAAGVIHDHYRARLRRDYADLVVWTDRIDAADLTLDQVLHPENYPYILLSMTVASRTEGDEAYWDRLVELLRSRPIDGVTADFAVRRRCAEVIAQNETYRRLLLEHTRLEGQVSVTDFRPLGSDPPNGNRFLVYSLFPEAVVSLKIRYERGDTGRVNVSIGHSIFNRGCRVNLGQMLCAFEGGGHRGAGGSTFPADKAEEYLARIIAQLRANQPNE
jgi:hypothetical protein